MAWSTIDQNNWLVQNGYLPSTTIFDANGIPVLPNQQYYVAYYGNFGASGGAFSQIALNPNYDPNWSVHKQTPTPPSVQYQFTFDTIGQVIIRTIGHCRVPLRIIWAAGVTESGQIVTSTTVSFAAALCAPFDPDEQGSIEAIFMGGVAVFDNSGGGFIAPDGMDPTTADLLKTCLENVTFYPGNETQTADSLIQADRGALTPGFRGLRYVVFPNWPTAVSATDLSVQYNRSNPTYTAAAVEFAAGSS